MHDRLSTGAHLELAEDDGNLVPYRFCADAETRANRIVVEALRDQFQHLMLARGEVVEGRGLRITRSSLPPRQEIIEFGNEPLPFRLLLEQDEIAGIQRRKPRTRDKRRNGAAFVE